MKLAVVVTDASGYIGAGLDLTRTVKLFQMPEDMQKYIESIDNKNQYITITISPVIE
jgi:hypothetical protein